MNSSDGLVIVIGGSGKIGKNFCLSALKITNYTIINIDPYLDPYIQKKINEKEQDKYLHIPIRIGNIDAAEKIIKILKEYFPEKKLNSIINLSRVNIDKKEGIIFCENDAIKNINIQILGLNYLIDQLINKNQFKDFSIIHAGSLNSRLVSHQSVLYHYLKGAIESASKALAFKLAKHNVRSNVIICGLIKDPSLKLSKEQLKIEEVAIPLSSGPATLDDVRNLILFLINPESRSITGTSFVIDAGMSLPDSYTVLSKLNDFN